MYTDASCLNWYNKKKKEWQIVGKIMNLMFIILKSSYEVCEECLGGSTGRVLEVQVWDLVLFGWKCRYGNS